MAEDKIEKDRILDSISTQPKQFKITLYSIFKACDKEEKGVFTGDIYSLYKEYCKVLNTKPITQRRLSDIVAELDMLGIINARVISKGRYGRAREISLGMPDITKEKAHTILKEGLGL